jgi:hypothetical protein
MTPGAARRPATRHGRKPKERTMSENTTRTIAELIEQHWELAGSDGPGANLMRLVWQHYPDAEKHDIHNAWADHLTSRATVTEAGQR